MIPLLGGALGLIATTVNAVGLGATAGAGYGLVKIETDKFVSGQTHSKLDHILIR